MQFFFILCPFSHWVFSFLKQILEVLYLLRVFILVYDMSCKQFFSHFVMESFLLKYSFKKDFSY